MPLPRAHGRRAAFVVMTVVALLGATACSDDEDRPDRPVTTASTGSEPSGAAPTTGGPESSASNFAEAEGVLVVGCGGQFQGRFYFVLDPGTGEVAAELDRVDLLDSGALGDGPLQLAPQNFCEEPGTLSPDRHRLALASDDFGDGSSHVGWVDLRSGEQTDLTAASVGEGFEAATPQDTNPRFGLDGNLWFERDGRLMVADPSGRISAGDEAAACTARATCGMLTHPSGRFFVDADDGITEEGLLLGSTDPSSGPSEDRAYGITVPLTVDGQPWSLVARYWLDERSLLCVGEEGDHRVVTIDPDALPLDTTEDVELPAIEAEPLTIPATERDILWTAPTPDGQALLFAATRGGEGPRLYRAEIGADAEPQELGPVPPGLDGDGGVGDTASGAIWIPAPDG